MLESEVVETLLHGCVACNPSKAESKAEYGKLQHVMPRLAKNETRRPHPILRGRAVQDTLQGTRGDDALTPDMSADISDDRRASQLQCERGLGEGRRGIKGVTAVYSCNPRQTRCL